MTVKKYDTAAGDGVSIGSPGRSRPIIVLPEPGDATDWHSYKSGEEYLVRAISRLHFRREIRAADGSTAVEEYDLQPGSTVKRTGPFEHRVINLADTPAVFCKG